MIAKVWGGILLIVMGIFALLIGGLTWVPKASDHPDKRANRIMVGTGIVSIVVGIGFIIWGVA